MKTKRITIEKWNNMINIMKRNNIVYSVDLIGLNAILKTPYCVYTTSLTEKAKNYSDGPISSSFKSMCNPHILREGEYGKYTYMTLRGEKKTGWDTPLFIKTGYTFANEYYSRTWLKCWSYDINSAFSFAMLKPMPDTEHPLGEGLLKENQMGFYDDGQATLTTGVICKYRFPLMPSPFSEYVYRYYEKKKMAKTKEERQKYKDYLNHPTGYLCKYNIFLRNAVIFYSNQYIQKYIDENTVYCNVDCIVSLTPRPDLPIGIEIGQFKEEKKCEDFKYINKGKYQWGSDCHYIGIPGEFLDDIEDTSQWLAKARMIIDKDGFINEKK